MPWTSMVQSIGVLFQVRNLKFIMFENHSKKSYFTTLRAKRATTKYQYWQKSKHFHEFFTQIFLTIFLVKSKFSTAKKSKTAAFSRVFTPNFFDNFSRETKVVKKSKTTTFSRDFHPTKKIDKFLGKSKLNFWTKMKIANSWES